jgi:hypothetical protein
MSNFVDEQVIEQPASFEKELCDLINKHSMERFSNTPDWVLARLLVRTLDAYASAVPWISPSVNEVVKAQSYYDKYWAAENELTATRDELDRIKEIVKQNNLSLDLENN